MKTRNVTVVSDPLPAGSDFFAPDTTYLIRSEVSLTGNIDLPGGVQLIFQGGKIVSQSPCTLTGNNTALMAPVDVIFGLNISVNGSWNIDRAYPLWFETSFIGTQQDFADSINKAIVMKSKGEVQLLKGIHFISKPIIIPQGAHLLGEDGDLESNNKETQIKPMESSAGSGKYAYKYMVYINCDINGVPDPYGKSHPKQWVSISNIKFKNNVDVFKPARCIYSVGNTSLDYVKWAEFLQAITFARTAYYDMRSITNCAFDNYADITIPDNLTDDEIPDYCAFDFGSFGDGLLFSHNGTGTHGQYALLYISQCGGGIISDNVLCGDVIVRFSKALTIENNHMEGVYRLDVPPQIKIRQSVVNITQNFIEKCSKPSIVVYNGPDTVADYDSSIVNLSGNQHLFYAGKRETDETLQTKEQRLESISEVDIAVDRRTLLNISNEYRYDFYGISGVRICGIMLAKADGSMFEEFNRFSYLLSQQSCILPNYRVQATATAHELNAPGFSSPQPVRHIEWFRPSGKYVYSYEILWDSGRGIKKTEGNTTRFAINSEQNPLELTHYGQGVLLSFNDAGRFRRLPVKLIRRRLDDHTLDIEEVVVPIISTAHFYDNGISVCGFKWRPLSLNAEFSIAHKYDTIDYVNGNIHAWTDSVPSFLNSRWHTGDLIYNTSADNNTSAVTVVKK